MAQIIGKLKEELRKEVEEENKNSQEVWRRTIEEQNKHNLEIMKHELKHAIKLELSQIVSQHSPPLEAPDIQVLAARVSMKGSCAKAGTIPSVKEPSDVHVDTMGLYVVHDQCTQLVALGKMCMTVHPPYTMSLMQMMWLG